MIKTGLYARISDDDPPDDDDRTSIPSQKVDGEEVAERFGLKIVDVYEDRETAGAEQERKSQQRPGFLAMLEAARAGQIDAVLVRDIDRLGRDAWTAFQFEELERERPEFRVYTTQHGLMSQDELDSEFAYAKKERRRIAARMNRGIQRALERGELPGGHPPIGYFRNDDNKPEIHEAEAAVVKQVLQWYLESVSLPRMAKQLNQDARYKMVARKRYANEWTRAVCDNIIRRAKFYWTGKRVYRRGGKEFTVKFPPIISKTLHDQVKARRKHNKITKGGAQQAKHPHLLKGMVKCPCGWTMTIRYDKRWPGNSHYRCQRLSHGKKRDPACPKSVNQRKLETDVWRAVEDMMFDPNRLQAAVQERVDEMRGEVEDYSSDLKQIEAALAQVEKERAWVVSEARTKLLSASDLKHQLAEVDLNQQQLENQQDELEKKILLADEGFKAASIALDRVAEDVELQRLLAMDLSKLKAEKGGSLPASFEFSVLAQPIEGGEVVRMTEFTEDGEPIQIDAGEVAQKLEAARYIEETDGDWAEALKKAQYEKKREVLQRYVQSVLVYLDDDGEKRVELDLAVPLTVVLPANSPARITQSSD